MAETKNNMKSKKSPSINMDYFEILKRSFDIVRHRRYLWYLGILAGGGFGSGLNGGGGNFSGFSHNKNGTIDANQIWTDISNWVHSHILLIFILASIFFILIAIFTLLSGMAKAGLVRSVGDVSEGKESSFMSAMRFGWHKFWNVFVASLVLGLIVFSLFLLVGAPAVLLFFLNPLMGILIVLAAIPFMIFTAILTGIIFEYALRYIAIGDKKAIDALKSGYGLMKEKKKETALIWLMTVGLMMVCGIILLAAIFIVGLILFLLGVLFFLLFPPAGIVYAAIAIAAFIVALVTAGGFMSSFVSAYWTLCFKELKAV